MRQKLSEIELESALATLPGWDGDESRISKTYELRSFVGAMEFVNRVAAVAERENHHPDIDIRYARVVIALSTHDAGGVTASDVILANEIEEASLE